MPQIICSHHAADPCSAVIGDRALLSTTEGVCHIFDLSLRWRASVHVFAFCIHDGEHKRQNWTVMLPASLPDAVVQFPSMDRLHPLK